MRERRINRSYHASWIGSVASSQELYVSPTEYISSQRYILDVVSMPSPRLSAFSKVWYSPLSIISSLKPLSTSGSAPNVLLLVPSVCFFKPDYAKEEVRRGLITFTQFVVPHVHDPSAI